MKTLEMGEKILEKIRGIRIKLPISHLLCVLVFQTWLFIKININIRKKKENCQKLKGYTYTITNISAANRPRAANI